MANYKYLNTNLDIMDPELENLLNFAGFAVFYIGLPSYIISRSIRKLVTEPEGYQHKLKDPYELHRDDSITCTYSRNLQDLM